MAFDIKNNIDFCHKTQNEEKFIYKYSRQLLSYIISLVIDDPEIGTKNKKPTLGAKASRQSLTGTASPAISITSWYVASLS